MVIDRIEKKNLLQKFLRLILGKEKPNFLTRISVLAGFIVWVYLVSWHIMTFLSIFLMDTLKHPEQIRATFYYVGSKEYGLSDTLNFLLIHSILEFIVFGVILIGLIMIWRRKRLGFLLYVFGNISTLIVTFFVLGYKYLINETGIFELIILICATLYFTIGLLLFDKLGSKEESTSENTSE